ncbi:MAG: ATPase [Cenarchaeum symbiont of Oopsacas minuta]|nr:ATPase [Cenarchaeum symbiont of Oopsacas minuta]
MASGTQKMKIYSAVKSYSQRGNLLSKGDLQAFAESRNLDELLTRIKNTRYANTLGKIVAPITAEMLESALRVHLADIHYSIYKTSGEPALKTYFMKFMIWNLKIILKGKILGKTQEELESKLNLHAEELISQRDIVLKALVAKDLDEAVINLSETVFGKDIEKAVTAYNESGNIQVFDTFFDKVLTRQLAQYSRKTSDRYLYTLISMDIDFYNILSVIRGRFWGLDPERIRELIEGKTASVSQALLDRMINAATVKDAFTELSTTRYRHLVSQKENDMEAISEFERNFEMAIYKSALNTFTRMFSPSTSVGITKLTGYEIRNIAAIAFGIEQKIPATVIMSKLIVDQE